MFFALCVLYVLYNFILNITIIDIAIMDIDIIDTISIPFIRLGNLKYYYNINESRNFIGLLCSFYHFY
jgi:hypothetical protein